MQFVKDFTTGIIAYFQGLLLILQHNLWLFILVPALLMASILFGGDWMLVKLHNVDLPAELDKIDFRKEVTRVAFQGFPTNLEELELLFIGGQLIFVILASKLNKYLVLILLSPMNTLVATRAEFVLTGNTYKFTMTQFVSDVFRGVNFAIRNLFTQLVVVLIWIILTLILPFLNHFTFWVMFLIGSYFYGASLLDYTLEKRKMSMERSYSFIVQNSGITLSVGILFSCIFFLPWGILLAPLSGVVAGTLALHKKYDLKKTIK